MPVAATCRLIPGETAAITVYASFVQPMPLRTCDVVLPTDSDGDGIRDGEAIAGLRCGDRSVAVSAVPNAVTAASFDLVSGRRVVRLKE